MSERESDFELEHLRAALQVAVTALEAIKKHKETLIDGRGNPAKVSTTWQIADKALADIKDSVYE